MTSSGAAAFACAASAIATSATAAFGIAAFGSAASIAANAASIAASIVAVGDLGGLVCVLEGGGGTRLGWKGVAVDQNQYDSQALCAILKYSRNCHCCVHCWAFEPMSNLGG
jgi:hypothetical protein